MPIRTEPTCWSTPISFARSVVLASLVDEGTLSITFRAQRDSGVALVCFEFRKPVCYRIERKQGLRAIPYSQLGVTLMSKPLSNPLRSELTNTDLISKFMLEPEDEDSGARFIFRARDCDVIVDSDSMPAIRTIATQRQKSA